MCALLDIHRETGRCPTLAEKFEAEDCIETLVAMKRACERRGRVLSQAETQAFARRHADLLRSIGGH